jgi:diadenosine tetraphosphate (Ap4A) HIT family hydrolase
MNMAEYEASTEEGNCIFCEIIKGNIKTPGVFWENDKYIAFLSIFPSVEGFTVVATKKHYSSDVLALPDGELTEFILAAKQVSKILIEHFEDVGRVGLIMEGTGVNHSHIKLIPMHGTGHMKKGIWKQYLPDKEEYFKKYEGYITSIEGPKEDDEKIKNLAAQLKSIK